MASKKEAAKAAAVDKKDEKFDKVIQIVDNYNRDKRKLIKILQEVQEVYSYLPEDVMNYIAVATGETPAHIYGVATFYSHFTLEAKGKHIIRVCDGTACHVKKSNDILKAVSETLALAEGKRTSGDGQFTLEVVACLGACGIAPVVVLDEKVYGSMNPEKTRALLNEVKQADLGGMTNNE